MQDGIIKGVGNSRFLKSVPAFLTLYPTYEAFAEALIAGTLPVDLNGINEAGWTQLGTALNKANLLSDATAGLLGGDEGMTPDGAFNRLSRFDHSIGDEYVWGKAHVTRKTNCREEYSSTWTYTAISSNDDGSAKTFYYGESFIAEDGKLFIENPKEATLSKSGGVSVGNDAIKGMCLMQNLGDRTLYRTSASSNVSFTSSGSRDSLRLTQTTTITATNQTTNAEVDKYVNSPNSSQYPPEESDGYVYFGPYRLGEAAKIASGYYVGTGSYGATSPCQLTFSSAIKLVALTLVRNNADIVRYDPAEWAVLAPATALGTTYQHSLGLGHADTALYAKLSEDGKTLSWYNTGSAANQANSLQMEYHYMAILE